MKIYAESQFVEVPTFNHVGYLATKTVYPNDTVSSIGGFMFFFGIIMSVAMIKVTKETKHKMTVFRFRKPILVPILGIAFILLGISAFAASYTLLGKIFWVHPESISQDRAMFIVDDIIEYINRNPGKADTKLPPEFNEAMKTIGSNSSGLDAWENTMMLKTSEYKGKTIYHVVSSGWDEKFDTDDDIDYPGYDEYLLDRYIERLHIKN